jgi:hypothetical protein
VPLFIRPDGAARFKRNPDGSPDGGVHDVFTIAGRGDSPAGCNVQQPDFTQLNNMSFRIPTSLFGAGLIEAIPDAVLRTNLNPTKSFPRNATKRQIAR